eukprot:SAG22_NODE_17006_length_313_cov_0.794393_1_plen_58_part_01
MCGFCCLPFLSLARFYREDESDDGGPLSDDEDDDDDDDGDDDADDGDGASGGSGGSGD